MEPPLLLLILALLCTQVDSQVTVSFEQQTSLVNEDVGSLEVNVTLSTANFSSPVFVNVATFEISGSAKGSQDFMPVDLRMEFPPGTDRQSVSLSIIDDNQVEQFEFFMLKAVIVNGNSSNDPTASIIIQDNDIPIIAFEELEYTFSETDRAANVCVVTVNGAMDRDVSFTVRTALGNASDIMDYIPFIYDELFISNGPTRICAFLTFQNDSLVESTEFFYAQLMVDGEISTNRGNTTKVFIADANGAVVRVVNGTGSATSLFTLTEGDVNTVLTLCAQLVSGGGVAPESSGLERDVPLLLTTTGITADRDDFLPVMDGLLVLPSGLVNGEMRCSDITILGDTVYETAESFNFTLRATNPSDSLEKGGTGSVVILNDDPVDCGPPPPPVNGAVDLPSTTFQSVAQYSCRDGFFLIGVSTRECQASGLWSDNVPLCISVETNENTLHLALVIALPLTFSLVIVFVVILVLCCWWRHYKRSATYSLEKYKFSGHISSVSQNRNTGFTGSIQQPRYGIATHRTTPSVCLSMVNINPHVTVQVDRSSINSEYSEVQTVSFEEVF